MGFPALTMLSILRENNINLRKCLRKKLDSELRASFNRNNKNNSYLGKIEKIVYHYCFGKFVILFNVFKTTLQKKSRNKTKNIRNMYIVDKITKVNASNTQDFNRNYLVEYGIIELWYNK